MWDFKKYNSITHLLLLTSIQSYLIMFCQFYVMFVKVDPYER